MSFSFWKVIASTRRSGPQACGGVVFLEVSLVFLPYLRVKRSTRPAASMSFCLPVKTGWQLEQISRRSSFLVERVVHVAPPAQWTGVLRYARWIPGVLRL